MEEENTIEKIDETVASPHDRLFKTTMGDIRVARDFFEHYLPPTLLNSVDLNNLEIQQNTYISKKLKLNSSDVLYKTTIAGNVGYIYILAEHQSTVDPLMPFRLLEYQVAIIRDHLKKDPRPDKEKKIPLIIPLILYAGKHPWNVSLDIRDLIDAPQELISKILNKPPHLIDATQLSDDVLVTQAWSNAMIYFLKHAWDRDALVYMRSIMGNLRWLEEVGGISGSNLVITFVNYVITNGEIKGSEEIKTLIDSLANELCPRTGAEIMTIAQRLREEGLQQGLHQGVQQGVHTGESNLLIILLTEKFHHVPEHYLREIKTANTDLIKKWVKYALRAEKIEEVFKKH